VIGLDDSDEENGETYNAAFHLLPHKTTINRYEKRVLLPLAEYLPFSFLKPLVARYGITDFFTHGKEAKVFEGAYPLNISICYEECFSHLIRQGKLGGAKLFINVTNDAWYPSSRLHLSHFSHGKLRAIENGVPVVRACNTGVTAAVDSLGRTVGQLGTENLEVQRGALITELNLYTYPTLYTYLGDYLIVALSFILILWAYIDHRKST
jgi:apolipoprotein N-acyltransferase